MSVFAQRMGTSTTGASLILGGTFSAEPTTVANKGIRDRITSAANRQFLYTSSLLMKCVIVHKYTHYLFPL